MEKSELVAITAAVINQQIKNVTNRLSGEILSFWQKNFSSFKEYIKGSHEKHKKTKTLLYKDQPVLLSEIYVTTRFKRYSKEVDSEHLLGELLGGKNILVTATAGAGKSFFAKSTFIKLLGSKESIPLIVELRHLNDTDRGIIDHLQHEFRGYKMSISRETIVELVEKGKFTLILDGFDELNTSKKKEISSELRVLVAGFQKSSILITTRPSDSEQIEYLPNLEVYKVQSLNLEQAMSLVGRLRYDEKVKKSFLDKLKSHLFEKHQDFLSNPLLLTIMLMTYADIAEIPSKMHIFYEQAFDTLFYKHDASKGLYKRDFKCNLPIDDFRDILACVSASSYIRGKVSFSNTELMSYIRKAKQTTNINNLNPQKYKEDLLQSVCILLNDGKRLKYNHRSFQEYFAALFLVQFPVEKKLQLYLRYLNNGMFDSALTLAFEMNQSVVEKEFVAPMVDKLLMHTESPEKMLQAWGSGVCLSWRGGRVGGTPNYTLSTNTYLWEFQVFIEKAYAKFAKKKIKFGLMTKKAYVEKFGYDKSTKRINAEDFCTPKNQELLEHLGILEIARRRILFVEWLAAELKLRKDRVNNSDIEEWL